MIPNHKKDRALRIKEIRERLGTYEIQQVLALLTNLRDATTAELLDCAPEKLQETRMTAKAYRDLLNMLLNERPQIEVLRSE